jgi:hypothetical protein
MAKEHHIWPISVNAGIQEAQRPAACQDAARSWLSVVSVVREPARFQWKSRHVPLGLYILGFRMAVIFSRETSLALEF